MTVGGPRMPMQLTTTNIPRPTPINGIPHITLKLQHRDSETRVGIRLKTLDPIATRITPRIRTSARGVASMKMMGGGSLAPQRNIPIPIIVTGTIIRPTTTNHHSMTPDGHNPHPPNMTVTQHTQKHGTVTARGRPEVMIVATLRAIRVIDGGGTIPTGLRVDGAKSVTNQVARLDQIP